MLEFILQGKYYAWDYGNPHCCNKLWNTISDVYQHTRKPLRRDESPLFLATTMELLDKKDVDFIVPINPPIRRIGAWYIITTMEYLTRWVKDMPIKYCTIEGSMWFIF